MMTKGNINWYMGRRFYDLIRGVKHKRYEEDYNMGILKGYFDALSGRPTGKMYQDCMESFQQALRNEVEREQRFLYYENQTL